MRLPQTTTILASLSLLTFHSRAEDGSEDAVITVDYRKYGHPSRSLAVLGNRFEIPLKSSNDALRDTTPVDDFGQAICTISFATVDKVFWRRTTTDQQTFILWPAYAVRPDSGSSIPNPLDSFTLTRLPYISGPAKDDLLREIDTAQNFGHANEIIKSLHHIYIENELLCRASNLPWRSRLSQIIREAVDHTMASRRLKPDGDMIPSNRIASLLYVSGWLRWGNRWMGSSQMSQRDQRMHLGDMLARCVAYSTQCYLPSHFGRAAGGAWPARTAGQIHDELDSQLCPVFESDAVFLHETFTDSVTSVLLETLIQDTTSLTGPEKELWKNIRHGGSGTTPLSLYESSDIDTHTWRNMNLAALEKLVNLTNRAAAFAR